MDGLLWGKRRFDEVELLQHFRTFYEHDAFIPNLFLECCLRAWYKIQVDIRLHDKSVALRIRKELMSLLRDGAEPKDYDQATDLVPEADLVELGQGVGSCGELKSMAALAE